MCISIPPWRSFGSDVFPCQPFFALEGNGMNKNGFPEAKCRVTSDTGEFPVRKESKGQDENFTGQLGTNHILYFLMYLDIYN